MPSLYCLYIILISDFSSIEICTLFYVFTLLFCQFFTHFYISDHIFLVFVKYAQISLAKTVIL